MPLHTPVKISLDVVPFSLVCAYCIRGSRANHGLGTPHIPQGGGYDPPHLSSEMLAYSVTPSLGSKGPSYGSKGKLPLSLSCCSPNIDSSCTEVMGDSSYTTRLLFFNYDFILFMICWDICTTARVCLWKSGDNLWKVACPSTMWLSGIVLGPSGLAGSALTH